MPKKPAQPYQPLLFRILHGLTGLFVIAAIVSAYWTYDTYDGRWGRPIPLPTLPEIEGIHGTFGLYALLLFPAFLVYAFRQGAHRLIQTSTLPRLAQVGQPAGWSALHRLTNTIALLSLTFALFSGKMMDEKWLPKGELDHGWYYAHLIGWVVMVTAIGLHLLMSAKVGGTPLLLSVMRWQFRPQEHPKHWWTQVRQWWNQAQFDRFRGWIAFATTFQWLEAALLLTIVAAWIIPILKG